MASTQAQPRRHRKQTLLASAARLSLLLALALSARAAEAEAGLTVGEGGSETARSRTVGAATLVCRGVVCQPGLFCHPDSGCSPCPAGQEAAEPIPAADVASTTKSSGASGSTSTSTSCVPCPPSMWSPFAGAPCRLCDAGLYTAEAGQAQCRPCPMDHFCQSGRALRCPDAAPTTRRFGATSVRDCVAPTAAAEDKVAASAADVAVE